jgi:hypothetical protein
MIGASFLEGFEFSLVKLFAVGRTTAEVCRPRLRGAPGPVCLVIDPDVLMRNLRSHPTIVFQESMDILHDQLTLTTRRVISSDWGASPLNS